MPLVLASPSSPGPLGGGGCLSSVHTPGGRGGRRGGGAGDCWRCRGSDFSQLGSCQPLCLQELFLLPLEHGCGSAGGDAVHRGSSPIACGKSRNVWLAGVCLELVVERTGRTDSCIWVSAGSGKHSEKGSGPQLLGLLFTAMCVLTAFLFAGLIFYRRVAPEGNTLLPT